MPQHPGRQHGSHRSRDPLSGGQRRGPSQEEMVRILQEAAGTSPIGGFLLKEHKQRTANRPVGPPELGLVATPAGDIIQVSTGEVVGKLNARGEVPLLVISKVLTGPGTFLGALSTPGGGTSAFKLLDKLGTLKKWVVSPANFIKNLKGMKPAAAKGISTKFKKEVETLRERVFASRTQGGVRRTELQGRVERMLEGADRDVVRVARAAGTTPPTAARSAAVIQKEIAALKAKRLSGKHTAPERAKFLGQEGVLSEELRQSGIAVGATGVAATVASKGASLGRTLGRNKLRTVGFLLGADYLGQKVEDVTGIDIPGLNDLFDTGPSPQEVEAQAAQVQAARGGARQVRGEGFITRAGQIRDQLVGDIVGRSQRGLEAAKVDLESQALSKVQARLNKVIEATGGKVTGEQALRAINTLQSPRMVQHFSLDEPTLTTQMDLEASIVEIMASPEFKQAGEPQNDLQEAGSGPE